MAEGDWDGWAMLPTESLGGSASWSGRPLRDQHRASWPAASQQGVANSVLIKLNQIGTVTETLDCIQMAHRAGYTCVVSHRSGETEDTFDLRPGAVALEPRARSRPVLPARGERTAKYNQLLRHRGRARRGRRRSRDGKSVYPRVQARS